MLSILKNQPVLRIPLNYLLKKKSGKWRMGTNLTAINKVNQPMGSLQSGIPLSSLLSKGWPLIVLDLKIISLLYLYKKKTEKNLPLQCLPIIILSLLKDIKEDYATGNVKLPYPVLIFC